MILLFSKRYFTMEALRGGGGGGGGGQREGGGTGGRGAERGSRKMHHTYTME